MLTLSQYQQLNSEHIEGVFEKMIHLVSVIDDIDLIDVEKWNSSKLIQSYNVAVKKAIISERHAKQIEIEGIKLDLIPSNQYTLGQFINLETYVNEGFEKNLDKISATLFLNIQGGGMTDEITEEYSLVNIDYRAELIGDIPVNQIYGACKKYLKFRENFFDSYEIFSDPLSDVDPSKLDEDELIIYNEEIKEREKQGSNQWLTILNILSNNDLTKFDQILKQNLFLTFNQLSWLKSNK